MFSTDQLSKLRRAGFIDREINEWQWAVSENGKPYVTDIDTPVWRDVIKARRDRRDELIKEGYSVERRVAFFERYYEKFRKASPFDWLKTEYRNPKKVKWQEARRKAFRDLVNRRLKKIKVERELIVKKQQHREKITKLAKDRQRKAVMSYLRKGELF